jgi:hypothetical protein
MRLAAAFGLTALVAAGFSVAARLTSGQPVGHTIVKPGAAVRAVRLAGLPNRLASPSVATHTSSNSQTFTDPTGDSGNAPDIGNMTVSNDDNGLVTFQIAIPNRANLDSAQDLVLIGLDTDLNASTGQQGIDYLLGAGGGSWDLLSWNGSSFVPAPSSTFSATEDVQSLTFTGNRSDLSSTNGFNFFVASTGDGGATVGDTAPDSGLYTFQLVVGVPTTTTTPTTTPTTTTPTTTTPTTTTSTPTATTTASHTLSVLLLGFPTKARAGRSFSVVMSVMDENGPVSTGSVACPARVGNKSIPVAAKLGLRRGVFSCRWVLPKQSRGKMLRGSITVTSEGLSVSRSFARKIG